MVNLLSSKEKSALLIRYRLRLVTITALMLSFAFAGGVALLMPAYFLAENEAEGAKSNLKSAESDIALSKFSRSGTEVSRTEERVSLLKDYQRVPAVERVLSRLTTHLTNDIGLTAIEVTRSDATSGTVIIRGIAKTRTALVDFGTRLQRDPAFQGVQVPLSDLVSDTNLTFSLPFTFKEIP